MKNYSMTFFLVMSLVSSISYADGFKAGVYIQNADIDEITLNQKDSTDGVQALNSATSSNMGVWQQTSSEDIKMTQSGGENSIQAINHVKATGGLSGSYQSTDAETATLSQVGGDGNVQAINVVESE